jgi:two-component system LytT family sensor kinase
MHFLRNRPYFAVAILVIPLLAMTTTTPIFLVVNRHIDMLPVVWVMATIPLTISWILNYHMYRWLKGKVILQWLVTTAIMLLIASTVRGILIDDIKEYLIMSEDPWLRQPPPLLTTLGLVKLDNTLIIVFQTLIRYRLQQVQFVKDLSEAKLQRVQAQYENLRNQIHPHFLFNTLNTLKILVHKDADKAEAYILKVSDFLRTSLQSNQTLSLTVEEDLRVAMNYLEIQEVRFKDCFVLDVDLTDEIKQQMVPVLTFQCLFENILKHNRLSKQQPIRIGVKQVGDASIEVTNTLIPLESDRMESTGTGLFNLNERFKILGGTEVEISEANMTFTVKINSLSK